MLVTHWWLRLQTRVRRQCDIILECLSYKKLCKPDRQNNFWRLSNHNEKMRNTISTMHMLKTIKPGCFLFSIINVCCFGLFLFSEINYQTDISWHQPEVNRTCFKRQCLILRVLHAVQQMKQSPSHFPRYWFFFIMKDVEENKLMHVTAGAEFL